MSDVLELLTPADAAKALGGISVRTLAAWRLEGWGPAYRKIGARMLYPLSELRAFVGQAPLRMSTADPGMVGPIDGVGSSRPRGAQRARSAGGGETMPRAA